MSDRKPSEANETEKKAAAPNATVAGARKPLAAPFLVLLIAWSGRMSSGMYGVAGCSFATVPFQQYVSKHWRHTSGISVPVRSRERCRIAQPTQVGH